MSARELARLRCRWFVLRGRRCVPVLEPVCNSARPARDRGTRQPKSKPESAVPGARARSNLRATNVPDFGPANGLLQTQKGRTRLMYIAGRQLGSCQPEVEMISTSGLRGFSRIQRPLFFLSPSIFSGRAMFRNLVFLCTFATSRTFKIMASLRGLSRGSALPPSSPYLSNHASIRRLPSILSIQNRSGMRPTPDYSETRQHQNSELARKWLRPHSP